MARQQLGVEGARERADERREQVGKRVVRIYAGRERI